MQMVQEYAIYAITAVSIVIMLALCLDVVRRNNATLITVRKESNTIIVETAPLQEKPPMYPVYVDCSHDFIKTLSHAPAEMKVLAPGHRT